MKGVSAVIAVILLLLITVAIIGFAFIWFGRITSLATNSTEQQITQFYQAAAKKISIDNINSTSGVSIRNIGTAIIPVNEITVFLNGNLLSVYCYGNSSTGIAPGTVATCRPATPPEGITCVAGTRIKVTSPAGSDERSC